MVSLNGLATGTFDSLFLRDQSGEPREIRALFTSSDSGVSTAYLESVMAPLQLSNLLTSNTVSGHTNSISTLTQDLNQLQQQTQLALDDPITNSTVQAHVDTLTAADTTINNAVSGQLAYLQALDTSLTIAHNGVSALQASQQTNTNELSTQSDFITQLNGSLATTSSQLTAVQGAVDTLTSESATFASMETISEVILQMLAPRDAQLETLSVASTNAENNIISQGGAIQTHTTAINAVEGDVSTMQTNITANETAITNLLATQASISSQLTDVDQAVSTTHATVNTLSTSVNNNTQTIGAHSTSLSTLSTSLSTLATNAVQADSQGNVSVAETLNAKRLECDEEVVSAHGTLGRYLFRSSESNLCLHHNTLPSSVQGNYALRVTPSGGLKLNCTGGEEIEFKSNDTLVGRFKIGGELELQNSLYVAGCVKIGGLFNYNDVASFCHNAQDQTANYAVKQTSFGDTFLNGADLTLCTGNTPAITIDSSQNVSMDSLTVHTCRIESSGGTNLRLKHTGSPQYFMRAASSGYMDINAGAAAARMYLRVNDLPLLQIQAGGVYCHSQLVALSNFTCNGTKAFDIPHPTMVGHRLRHRCIESDRAINVYRHKLTCFSGKNTFPLPVWWVINTEAMAWVSPYRHRGQGWADVEDNNLIVDASRAGVYLVWLTGIRSDSMATEEFEQYGVEYEQTEISP